jgi:tRNA (cmo5U34)-methyltransferase
MTSAERGIVRVAVPGDPPDPEKSSVDEIRRRFDGDVERFSNFETGQNATIDAPLVMELIGQTAAATNPTARRALDVGCGAGNYSLKLLELLPDLEIDLVDLSAPMLERAAERIARASPGTRVTSYQADIRDLPLQPGRYDVAVAAAALHHLREAEEWERVFATVFRAIRPGGSLWISDLVEQSSAHVQDLMWIRYGAYLEGLGGVGYRDHVFGYIEREDTPRPLMYQLDLLRAVGFRTIDVLYKNGPFAAFGAIRDG